MRSILVAALSVLAFSANAESTQQRPSMEPTASPFTYEVLGATPSLRLPAKSQPQSETAASGSAQQTAGKVASKASSVEASDAAARTAAERDRVARSASK